jgi:hypothetical protein
MILANRSQIADFTNAERYGDDVAAVNAAVVAATSGRVPCYAIKGKRVPFKWVSVGSSCIIPRGDAADWLSRYGADIDAVETIGISAGAVPVLA